MPHNGYVAGSDKTQLQVIGRKEGLTWGKRLDTVNYTVATREKSCITVLL